MLPIKKLPRAEEDLIDIWLYGYEHFGIAQADYYIDSIETMLNGIANFPKKHRLRNSFRPPIRICHHVSHLIIYTIEDDAIVIIRVLHKSMDVVQHL